MSLNNNGTIEHSTWNDDLVGITMLAPGDLNGDNVLDLAISSTPTQTIGLILSSTAARTFSPLIPPPGIPSSLQLCDVDKDGNLDLIVSLVSDTTTRAAYPNMGKGLFNATAIPISPTAIRVDFTPSIDATVIGYHVVRARTPTGPYSSIYFLPLEITSFLDTSLNPETCYYYIIYEVDIGFSLRKLTPPFGVCTLPLPTEQGSMVAYSFGLGDGDFSEFSSHDIGPGAISTALGDLNQDGLNDLLTLNSQSRDLSLLKGTGPRSFRDEVRIPLDSTLGAPTQVNIVDADSDGEMEIVVASGADGRIGIYDWKEETGLIQTGVFELGPDVIPLIDDFDGDEDVDLLGVSRGRNLITFVPLGGTLQLKGRGSSFRHAQIGLDQGLQVSEPAVTVQDCEILNSNTDGLKCTLNEVYIESCTARNNVGRGFVLPNAMGYKLIAKDNVSTGIVVNSAIACRSISNGSCGIVCVSASGCVVHKNLGSGILGEDRVVSCVVSGNVGGGVVAREGEDIVSTFNQGFGIFARSSVTDCLAIGNGQGIQAPFVENSQVIGTFGTALAGEGAVNDSAILENASISSDTIQFNNTILAGNAESATLDQIDGMYIAGNAGGGARGIPVSNSTIIGNKGPGVDQNVGVTDSNVVFNEGPGVVGGSVSGSYVKDNRDGDLTGGAVGTVVDSPVETAPAFVANVQINLATITLEPTQTLGVGRAEFFLTYSKDMDTSRRLWVTFGQSSPFTSFIVAASPGWTDARTWRGYFDVGGEVGSGTHTLRVSGARALPDALFPNGFEIPPDTYHRFTVDNEGGLALNNGRIVARTETSLTLAWDPSLDVDPLGFSIVRKEGLGPFRRIGFVQAGSTEFINSGLTPGITYSYQVYESVSPNSYRELTRTVVGSPGLPFTPTPTPSATSTPTNSPIPTPTSTPCSPYDLSPDCLIDARDLLEMLGNGDPDPMAFFDFAQMWMSPSP